MSRATEHGNPSHTGTGGTKTTTATRAGGTGLSRGLITTLSDMERFMEEAFHRPFFSWHMMPFRHMLDESDFGDFIPAIDIVDGKDEIVVKAELPGMKREEIDVSLVDGMLVISGEKTREGKEEHRDYLRIERSHGSFRRTLAMPEGIDDSHVAATYNDGVLEIRLPKLPHSDVGRHIKIE